MKFKDKEREDPRPELTSLVDIIFILVLFLTVTTTFATSGGINVSLPQASSQRPLEKADKLFVVINKEGDAFIEGEKLTNQQLSGRFKTLSRAAPDGVVVLQADQATLHGRVVEVMDLAEMAGLKRLAIAAEQKPVETPGEGPAPAETSGSTVGGPEK
ncbi:MAG TPA: biopolymer transporter ExbD [bacterium]|nr:biopolymer transporter ExbD [bacterium]